METTKYSDAVKKHQLTLSDAQVEENVKVILQDARKNHSIEVYKTIFSCIDMTTLNSTDTNEEVWKFTEKVNQFEDLELDIENVGAICVYPNFAKVVKDALTADVKIACVAGGFPSSQTFTEIKIAETALAVSDGANEIDIVINLGLFFSKEYEDLCDEIQEIKFAAKDATLKVILETGALKTAKPINDAAILAIYSGADFIKTSTGKVYNGASPEAAYVICKAIQSYYEKTGKKIGVKVAGGVSSVDEAVKYYTIVKNVLGVEWCNKEFFRIGTSKLTDAILSAIKTQN